MKIPTRMNLFLSLFHSVSALICLSAWMSVYGQTFFSPDAASASNSDLEGSGSDRLIDRSGLPDAAITRSNITTVFHSDGQSGDGWRGSTTALPITLTFDFDAPQSVRYVGLWQTFSVREGVRDFTLRFWDGSAGSGNQIGTGYTGVLDTGLRGDNSILMNGRTFDVGDRRSVRSVTMEVTSVAQEINPHVHLGEFMVAGSSAVWPVAQGGSGNSYEVVAVPGGISWEDARDAASAAGGHLATITSAAENDFVWNLVKDRPELWYVDGANNTVGPWLGGFQVDGAPEPDGGWQWLNGEGPFDYTNWAAGEPNNSNNSEHRAGFFGTGPDNRAATWNDLSPEPWAEVLGYVVEYGDDVSLALHLPFDESSGTIAHDAAFGNHGSLAGAATWLPGGGVAGGAISLNRESGDLVNLGNILPLEATDFTISLWIKTSSQLDETFPVARHRSGIVAGYLLGLNRSGDAYGSPGRAFFYGRGEPALAPVSQTTVTDDIWHHIVATYDDDGVAQLYIDGAPDGTPQLTANIVVLPDVPLLVGGILVNDVPTALYDGLVDDLQIYTRVLEPAEVATLFQNPGETLGTAPEKGETLRFTSFVRDPGTGAVTLTWQPPITAGMIERSRDLRTWEPLAESITGASWTGIVPGNPREAYLRVGGALTEP